MENQPQQIQVNLDPNAYLISGVNMGFDEENFHFLITSGNQGRQFMATPKHAKRIYLLMKQQMEAYEKQFGELRTQLPEIPKTTQEENQIGF